MSFVAGTCASTASEGAWDCEAQASAAPVEETGLDVAMGYPMADTSADIKLEHSKSEAETDCTSNANTDFDSRISLGDAECGCAGPAATEIVNPKSRRGCRVRRKRCGLCAFASSATVGVLLFFLWPRNPEWKVKEITVSESAITGLAASFMASGNGSSARYPLNASVVMTNHDWIGASAGVGHFVVSYDRFKLAEAQTLPATIGSRDSGMVHSTSLAQVPSGAGAVLLAALTKSNMHIVVDVVGGVPVHAMGLTININLACQVDVDVMQLMAVPADMIGGHNCSYSYSLR